MPRRSPARTASPTTVAVGSPGAIYIVLAIGILIASYAFDDSVIVNAGWRWAALALAVVGIISLVTGVRMHVDERAALVVGPSGRRVPRRSRLRAAGVARPAQPADVARARRTRRRIRPVAGASFSSMQSTDRSIEALVEDNPDAEPG